MPDSASDAAGSVTPAAAWKSLKEGNERFVAGRPQYPNQSVRHREGLAGGQQPKVALFGCSDSRVAVEIVFDQGLGDMFVVRTAGHVLDSAVLGSLEFAVTALEVPLIAVLGHESCGAVKATLAAVQDGEVPGGYVRDIVERLAPSILLGRCKGLSTTEDFVAHHVRETGSQLLARSTAVAEGVAAGRLAVVGLTYGLTDGRVVVREAIGDIGE